jgi:hypothetical protein
MTVPETIAAKAAPSVPSATLLARHAELEEEGEILDSAPRPLTEAAADIEKAISDLASRWSLDQVGSLAHADGWPHLAQALVEPTDLGGRPLSPVMALAKLAPDLVAAGLRQELQRVYATFPKPIATPARTSRRAELTRELAELQVRLAAAWWAEHDAGSPEPPPEQIEIWALLGLKKE